MGADAPDQAANIGNDLLARRRLCRAQDESDRTLGPGLVDMDRRITALAVEAVPEGQLLCTMRGVERVVDVQCDRAGRSCMAVAVDVDHLVGQGDQRAQGRGILPPGHCGLTGQTEFIARRPPKRHHERGITTQRIKIIGARIPCRDRQKTGAQDVGKAVPHPRRIAMIGDQCRKSVGDPQ